MLPEAAAISASVPAPSRFSEGLVIPFKQTLRGGADSSCWKTLCTSQGGSLDPTDPSRHFNLVSTKALPLFGYELATSAETLRVRVQNVQKSFLALYSLLSAQEECLQRQQKELLSLQGVLPSARMETFHRSCLKLHLQRMLFEQVIVRGVVRDALSTSEAFYSSDVKNNQLETTVQEDSNPMPSASLLTEVCLKLNSLKSFVELEMACTFSPLLFSSNSTPSLYPAAVQESICMCWAAAKREVPVDEIYYDYVDLIGKWGRQWPSTATIIKNRAIYSEVRLCEDEEKVFSDNGIFSKLRRMIADTVQKESHGRINKAHQKDYIEQCGDKEIANPQELIEITTTSIL
ncbi:unnamed protein product [Phytomonas sp. Hart1]|nr:unnamed protein product [Phytomonas sp. Hart1]|eukprot:CCW69887.1 unnamed protein product [Phytomonas sp. isolate Hart1]